MQIEEAEKLLKDAGKEIDDIMRELTKKLKKPVNIQSVYIGTDIEGREISTIKLTIEI